MKRRLSDLLAGSTGRVVGNRVRDLGRSLGDAATRSAQAVASRAPDAQTLRRGVGDALVFGGRLLHDPRSTVGEMAVSLGQGLRGGRNEAPWLLLKATDNGFTVIASGTEAQMRLAWEQQRASGALLRVEVRAASDAAGGQ
jgi:hypothetical protein